MPIAGSDIKYRLSGGSSNADANASLGGAMSSTAAPAGMFDTVNSTEAAAGDVEYRCYYVLNDHATLTLQAAKHWITANTPGGDTDIEIGLGTTAVGTGNEQTVANESTAPTGVTFSAAGSEGAALSIGDIPPGHHKAIWAKRNVNAAAAAANETFNYRTKGDTAA